MDVVNDALIGKTVNVSARKMPRQVLGGYSQALINRKFMIRKASEDINAAASIKCL
jgi:hypothetical protein